MKWGQIGYEMGQIGDIMGQGIDICRYLWYSNNYKKEDIFMQKTVQKKADKKVYKTNEFIQKARFDLTLT